MANDENIPWFSHKHKIYSCPMDPLDCPHCRVGSLVSAMAAPDPAALRLNKSDFIWLRMIGSQLRHMKTLSAYTRLSFPKLKFRRGRLCIAKVRSTLPKYYLRWWGKAVKYLHIMAKREKMCNRARYLVCENAAIILNEALNRYLDQLPELHTYKSWHNPCACKDVCEQCGEACGCPALCECGCPCQCGCHGLPGDFDGTIQGRGMHQSEEMRRASQQARFSISSGQRQSVARRQSKKVSTHVAEEAIKEARRFSEPAMQHGRPPSKDSWANKDEKKIRSYSTPTGPININSFDIPFDKYALKEMIKATNSQITTTSETAESKPLSDESNLRQEEEQNQASHNQAFFRDRTRNSSYFDSPSTPDVSGAIRNVLSSVPGGKGRIKAIDAWVQFLTRQPDAVLQIFKDNPQELQDLMQHEEGAVQRFGIINYLLEQQHNKIPQHPSNTSSKTVAPKCRKPRFKVGCKRTKGWKTRAKGKHFLRSILPSIKSSASKNRSARTSSSRRKPKLRRRTVDNLMFTPQPSPIRSTPQSSSIRVTSPSSLTGSPMTTSAQQSASLRHQVLKRAAAGTKYNFSTNKGYIPSGKFALDTSYENSSQTISGTPVDSTQLNEHTSSELSTGFSLETQKKDSTAALQQTATQFVSAVCRNIQKLVQEHTSKGSGRRSSLNSSSTSTRSIVAPQSKKTASNTSLLNKRMKQLGIRTKPKPRVPGSRGTVSYSALQHTRKGNGVVRPASTKDLTRPEQPRVSVLKMVDGIHRSREKLHQLFNDISSDVGSTPRTDLSCASDVSDASLLFAARLRKTSPISSRTSLVSKNAPSRPFGEYSGQGRVSAQKVQSYSVKQKAPSPSVERKDHKRHPSSESRIVQSRNRKEFKERCQSAECRTQGLFKEYKGPGRSKERKGLGVHMRSKSQDHNASHTVSFPKINSKVIVFTDLASQKQPTHKIKKKKKKRGPDPEADSFASEPITTRPVMSVSVSNRLPAASGVNELLEAAPDSTISQITDHPRANSPTTMVQQVTTSSTTEDPPARNARKTRKGKFRSTLDRICMEDYTTAMKDKAFAEDYRNVKKGYEDYAEPGQEEVKAVCSSSSSSEFASPFGGPWPSPYENQGSNNLYVLRQDTSSKEGGSRDTSPPRTRSFEAAPREATSSYSSGEPVDPVILRPVEQPVLDTMVPNDNQSASSHETRQQERERQQEEEQRKRQELQQKQQEQQQQQQQKSPRPTLFKVPQVQVPRLGPSLSMTSPVDPPLYAFKPPQGLMPLMRHKLGESSSSDSSKAGMSSPSNRRKKKRLRRRHRPLHPNSSHADSSSQASTTWSNKSGSMTRRSSFPTRLARTASIWKGAASTSKLPPRPRPPSRTKEVPQISSRPPSSPRPVSALHNKSSNRKPSPNASLLGSFSNRMLPGLGLGFPNSKVHITSSFIPSKPPIGKFESPPRAQSAKVRSSLTLVQGEQIARSARPQTARPWTQGSSPRAKLGSPPKAQSAKLRPSVTLLQGTHMTRSARPQTARAWTQVSSSYSSKGPRPASMSKRPRTAGLLSRPSSLNVKLTSSGSRTGSTSSSFHAPQPTKTRGAKTAPLLPSPGSVTRLIPIARSVSPNKKNVRPMSSPKERTRPVSSPMEKPRQASPAKPGSKTPSPARPQSARAALPASRTESDKCVSGRGKQPMPSPRIPDKGKAQKPPGLPVAPPKTPNRRGPMRGDHSVLTTPRNNSSIPAKSPPVLPSNSKAEMNFPEQMMSTSQCTLSSECRPCSSSDTDMSVALPAFETESRFRLRPLRSISFSNSSSNRPCTPDAYSSHSATGLRRRRPRVKSTKVPRMKITPPSAKSGSKRDVVKTSSKLLLRAIGLAMKESVENVIASSSRDEKSASVQDLVTVASCVTSNPTLMSSLLSLVVEPLTSSL